MRGTPKLVLGRHHQRRNALTGQGWYTRLVSRPGLAVETPKALE
jgi:hypothetical protein